MRTLRVNGLNVWPIICTRVRVSAHVLTKTLAIIRVRRSLPGLQVSFEAEKIKAPTRCRARISLVGTQETTMGKDKGRVVSVSLQVELDVVTRPGRVGDLPAHASGRVKLFDRYLGHKPLAIEPELSGGADLRFDGSVARPPLTNSIGRRDRLIDTFRGRVNFDQVHDVVHGVILCECSAFRDCRCRQNRDASPKPHVSEPLPSRGHSLEKVLNHRNSSLVSGRLSLQRRLNGSAADRFLRIIEQPTPGSRSIVGASLSSDAIDVREGSGLDNFFPKADMRSLRRHVRFDPTAD